MIESIRGGCTCGAVKYQYSGEPLTACHCTDCQTMTGSAFALSMIVRSDDHKLLDGVLALQAVEQDTGERYLCRHCKLRQYSII